jgi:ABC-type glycerol-3-phosphate transport system substrate-binding protein
VLLFLLLAMATGMVACGGGTGGGAVNPPTHSSTSTTVTITGTAGNLQHASSVNVIVQ